jgi:hypothetical protein
LAWLDWSASAKPIIRAKADPIGFVPILSLTIAALETRAAENPNLLGHLYDIDLSTWIALSLWAGGATKFRQTSRIVSAPNHH